MITLLRLLRALVIMVTIRSTCFQLGNVAVMVMNKTKLTAGWNMETNRSLPCWSLMFCWVAQFVDPSIHPNILALTHVPFWGFCWNDCHSCWEHRRTIIQRWWRFRFSGICFNKNVPKFLNVWGDIPKILAVLQMSSNLSNTCLQEGTWGCVPTSLVPDAASEDWTN